MFIEQAYKGLSEGWRYLVGIMAVFFAWQFIGAVPLLAVLFTEKDAITSTDFIITDLANTIGSNQFLFLMLLAFVVGLVFLFFFVRIVHKQSIHHLTTTRKRVDWGRVFTAFFIWGSISSGFLFLDIYMSPEDYEFQFNLEKFLILAAIAIAYIPIQTSMEEYFIRGYMMQGIGVSAGNRWVPLLITSLLFGLMHIFNPEVAKIGYGIMVYYIGTGFFLGIMTLMDEGLELPIGFHAANNLTAALLVTADWTAFSTDSIYRDISEPTLGWDVFIPVLVVYPILLLLFAGIYKWKNWKEKLFGKVLTKEEFVALEQPKATSTLPAE